MSLKQEEKEEANAVISTPDKEEEARDQGVRTGTEAMQGSVAAISTSEEEEEARDQGVKVGSGGMQGSVAESSASSNARKQSTSSEASSRPKPVSPGGSSVGKQTLIMWHRHISMFW